LISAPPVTESTFCAAKGVMEMAQDHIRGFLCFPRPRTQARDRESDGEGKPSMPRAAANRAPPRVHGEKSTAFAVAPP